MKSFLFSSFLAIIAIISVLCEETDLEIEPSLKNKVQYSHGHEWSHCPPCRCICSGYDYDRDRPRKCGENEKWYNCKKRCSESCLRDSCDRDREPECEAGCRCLEGFARINGRCQPDTRCSSDNQNECPVNEFFTTCVNRRDESCNIYSTNDYSDDNKNNCIHGCQCKRGFVRINNRCVPESECEEQCPINEIFSRDVDDCSDLCPNEKSICSSNTVRRNRCECKYGFSRFSIGSKCLPKDRCSPPCPKNEIFVPCYRQCNELCQLNQPACIPDQVPGQYAGKEYCESGCTCAPGFARVGKTCVPILECPTKDKCGINEVYDACHKDDLCDLYCREPLACLSQTFASKDCRAGCFCQPNYKFINGSASGCVHKSQCVNSYPL